MADLNAKSKLGAWFIFSALLGITAILQMVSGLDTGKGAMVWFFGGAALLWFVVMAAAGLDLFRGDHIIRTGTVVKVWGTRVWVVLDSGGEKQYVVTDPAELDKLAPAARVELVLAKRTRQLKAIHCTP